MLKVLRILAPTMIVLMSKVILWLDIMFLPSKAVQLQRFLRDSPESNQSESFRVT